MLYQCLMCDVCAGFQAYVPSYVPSHSRVANGDNGVGRLTGLVGGVLEYLCLSWNSKP